jgi:alkanesulfonate monooxygenase SsuD/methylene tetrahydromethanopterin reductase-like flavin-dependent oxidoreductase (luciferase family)
MTDRRPLRKLSFLHIVPYERADPAKGLNEALDLFEYAEELGLDGGWIRTRHLQYGVSSAAAFLAAASQRTRRIDLGTAVIPTVYESPLRLAEDLGTADLLSGGRLQPGLSVGPPRIDGDAAARVLGADWEQLDTSYARVERILDFLRGEAVDTEHPIGLGGVQELSSDRVEPHSPGLAERTWYGGGSIRSAEWAGRQGLKLLVSSITSGEGLDVFDEAQRRQIDAFRAASPFGEDAVVAQGHVVIPTDGATAAQRDKFAAYVAARTPRTLTPQAGGRLIAKDITGSTADIVGQLVDDRGFQAADEFLFELPFQFDQSDYRHILRHLATEIGPALGWTPKA